MNTITRFPAWPTLFLSSAGCTCYSSNARDPFAIYHLKQSIGLVLFLVAVSWMGRGRLGYGLDSLSGCPGVALFAS